VNAWTTKLEPLGIKLIQDVTESALCFIKCTEIITPKCLQAACTALPIVKPVFIDALVEAQDAMERDFALVPDPANFEADPELAVNIKRKKLFLGMTFAFWDPAQHKQISPIITAAGGTSILQFKSNIQLKVVDIAAFIQQAAREASDNKVSVDKAIKSGALIPVKMVIGAPEVKQTELLVRVNKATKALGIYLMDQIMFTKAIKAVDSRNMFRLRPGGPIPNLLREDDVNTAVQTVLPLVSVAENRAKPSTSFQSTQVHIMEQKRPKAIKKTSTGAGGSANITDFFDIASVAPSQSTAVSSQASLQPSPAPFTPPTVAETAVAGSRIKRESSQDIFTFFTQTSEPVKAKLPLTSASQSSLKPTKRSDEVIDKSQFAEDADSAVEEVQQQASAGELSRMKRQALVSVNALEEATQNATEYKRRKMDNQKEIESTNPEKGNPEDEVSEDVEMIESFDEVTPAVPCRPKVTFEDAVRKIKQEQTDVYSYQHGDGIANNEEDEDITQLKNLAIVEIFPMERADRVSSIKEQGRWAGRQNFKRFVKRRLGVVMQQKDQRQQHQVRSSKGSSSMVVTLVQADPHEFRVQSHIDWLASAQAPRARDATPAASIDIDMDNNSTNSNSNGEGNGGESLFMGAFDDDDDDDYGLNAYNKVEDDDEEDEIEKTSFRRLKSAHATVSPGLTRLPTPASATAPARRAPARTMRTTNPRDPRTPRPTKLDSSSKGNHHNDDENDDDDDDGFKFKFSTKK
jgi:hypothetical protein